MTLTIIMMIMCRSALIIIICIDVWVSLYLCMSLIYPCRCLCRLSRLQITNRLPRRRTILQPSQRFLIEARTFIPRIWPSTLNIENVSSVVVVATTAPRVSHNPEWIERAAADLSNDNTILTNWLSEIEISEPTYEWDRMNKLYTQLFTKMIIARIWCWNG